MKWKEIPNGRSLPCNGDLLRHHRNRRGWTQQELATRAGYSSRVIAKAEAHGSVQPNTIETLAETLSLDSDEVFPEELVYSPKAIARKILEYYAQYEKDCAKYCHAFLAEDVQLIVPGDQSILPFAGTYDGVEGWDAFWANFFAVMERHDKRLIIESMRVFAEGNTVIILTNECASFVGSPGPYTVTPIGFVFEFERGKLKRLEDHFDAAAAQERVRDLLETSDQARDAHRSAGEHSQ